MKRKGKKSKLKGFAKSLRKELTEVKKNMKRGWSPRRHR